VKRREQQARDNVTPHSKLTELMSIIEDDARVATPVRANQDDLVEEALLIVLQ
jgi:hypothetical protein